MIYSFFKSVSPAISVKIFYVFMCFIIIYRFLFQTVYGALLISIGLYEYVSRYTSIKPYTADQLLYWITNLNSDYKIALFSSCITIAGFAIAFHTATSNWCDQMRAQLMLQVSIEIDSFFTNVSRSITTAELYAERLVKSVNDINNGISQHDAEFIIDYSLNEQKQFLDCRRFLSEASIEVHRLIARNYNSLASNWGALNAVQKSALALAEISQKMWFHLPIIVPELPERVSVFVNQINISECTSFIQTCQVNQGIINGLSGGLRGQLQSTILGFNFAMFTNLLTKREQFNDSINEFHRNMNGKS